MLIFDALRTTRGAARVTKSKRRILTDLGPLKMCGLPLNKCFVINRVRQTGRPTFKSGLGRDHDPFHRRNPSAQFFEQRQHVGIRDNQSITSVINDVFEIGFRQTNVKRVQYRPHARCRMVCL